MPFDSTGAYVPELQPPTPESIGVAPTAITPRAPEAVPGVPLAADDPNARPLVLSPTQEPLPVPQIAPAPSVPPLAPSALPQVVPAPASAPTAPVAPHAGGAGGGILADVRAASKEQQAAALNQGDVQQKAQEDLAAAHGREADAYQQQADEARTLREAQTKAQDEAHQQTEQALETARAKQIPNFWAGREGQRTETAIWVGLGGVAQGLLGTSTNGAADIVKHNVDTYYAREKEKVDNLYKFAAAKGQSEESLRLNHAQALTALQAQFGATKLAIAARVDQVTAAGQGRIDVAKGAALAANLKQEGNAAILSARNTLSEINLRNAEAQRARDAAKTAAAQEKEVKPISAEFDKDEQRLMGTSRSPGLIPQQAAVRELGDNLRNAVKSGDAVAVKDALVLAKEKIARLNTGAAPSHAQMKMLEDLVGDPAKAQERINSLLGNPKAAQQTIGAIQGLIDESDEGLLKQIDKQRGQVVQKYIGNGTGIAKTKAQREHVLGRIAGLTNGITTRTPQGEAARYQEGGGSTAPAAPAGRSFSSQDDAAISWANNNPQDPRSAKIHQAQGR